VISGAESSEQNDDKTNNLDDVILCHSCHHGPQFYGYYGLNNLEKVWRVCYMSDIGFMMNRLGVLRQEHPLQVLWTSPQK